MSDEPLWRRYRRFLRADPRRDVDDEVEFHLSMRIDEYEQAGLSAAEAREEAMRRFGNVNEVLGECHEIGRQRAERGRRSWRWQSFTQDVRVGLRGLAANRGYALGVILTMAIGIGATTAVFSVMAYAVRQQTREYAFTLRPAVRHRADGPGHVRGRRDTSGNGRGGSEPVPGLERHAREPAGRPHSRVT